MIAALAWNEAIMRTVDQVFTNDQRVGLFIYATTVTVLGIVAVILIGRAIARLKATVVPEKR